MNSGERIKILRKSLDLTSIGKFVFLRQLIKYIRRRWAEHFAGASPEPFFTNAKFTAEKKFPPVDPGAEKSDAG